MHQNAAATTHMPIAGTLFSEHITANSNKQTLLIQANAADTSKLTQADTSKLIQVNAADTSKRTQAIAADTSKRGDGSAPSMRFAERASLAGSGQSCMMAYTSFRPPSPLYGDARHPSHPHQQQTRQAEKGRGGGGDQQSSM